MKRQEFKYAETVGLFTAVVIPAELRRAKISDRCPAYVAAIIRKIVQLESSL
jgi:hypothetical protein